MNRNIRQTLIAPAALLLMAAISLGTASCTQDNDEPGGTLPEGGITLVPAVAPVTAWNAGGNAADTPQRTPGTRADATIGASLTGGELIIMIARHPSGGGEPTYPDDILGSNYFSVSTDGKLTRVPFSGRPVEMEAPLGIDAPGEYLVGCSGEVSLITDGITYRSYISNNLGQDITIGTDGKLTLPLSIDAGGLRLNVKNTDGTAYTGADVTATLKTVSQAGGVTAPFDVKTLTSGAPAAIWGDISSNRIVNAGAPVLELATGGKTYHVNAPRQISFTVRRLYTFNVRVGATGITVSSDDLGIADFEAVAVTNVEAEPVPLYEGQPAKLLAIPGRTAYWVAPVDANASITWINIDFDAICPAGWHVPTKDDFEAMTGFTADSGYFSENYDALEALFSADNSYWSSTEHWRDASCVWRLTIRNKDHGTAGIDWTSKEADNRVRCVRAK